MAATTESEIRVGKKKKVSKKSKRSWRKFTDIKDVEEHLEEVRREERTGGLVSEKPDASLFFVDTKSKEPEDNAQGKRSRKRKLLKCDQLLLPDTRIKPVGSKKIKLNKNMKNMLKQNSMDSDSSEEEEEQSKPLLKGNNNQEKWKKIADFDLWGSEEKSTEDEHYLKVTMKKKIKMPKTTSRQVTELPAVDICHPGASYNPALEDHQDLLGNANEVEVKKVKEIEKLDRKIKYLSAEEAAALPTWEEEMGEGLFDDGVDDDEDDDNGDEDDDDESDEVEDIGDTSTSTGKMKTKQQRRKQMDEKEKQKEQDVEKEAKLKENDIFRIKTLKKEIQTAEMEAEKRKLKKQEKKDGELQRQRRLGRHTYVKPDVEIQLSDEVTGNLRSLKQEGNLFTDRFRNLQKRNIIEPRVPVIPHRKYALKEYERRSYKKPCINNMWDKKPSKKKK